MLTTKTKEECSVIIRFFTAEDEDKLSCKVRELFQDALGVSVHVESVDRFKSYGSKVGPVMVTLRSKDDLALVLQVVRMM